MTRKNSPVPTPDEVALHALLSLPSNCSKADEQALLNEITQALTPGTYLASMISPRLGMWFGYQSNNDLNTDIMDVVESLSRDLHKVTAEAAGTQAALERDIANTKMALTREQMKVTQIEAVLTATQNTHANELAEADAAYQRLEKLTDSYQAQYREADGALIESQEKNAALELEIIRLKARLFDLTEAGK